MPATLKNSEPSSIAGIDAASRAGLPRYASAASDSSGNRQIASEAIARSAGNDRQRNVGAGQRRRGAIDRPVAAPGDNEIETGEHRIAA